MRCDTVLEAALLDCRTRWLTDAAQINQSWRNTHTQQVWRKKCSSYRQFTVCQHGANRIVTEYKEDGASQYTRHAVGARKQLTWCVNAARIRSKNAKKRSRRLAENEKDKILPNQSYEYCRREERERSYTKLPHRTIFNTSGWVHKNLHTTTSATRAC